MINICMFEKLLSREQDNCTKQIYGNNLQTLQHELVRSEVLVSNVHLTKTTEEKKPEQKSQSNNALRLKVTPPLKDTITNQP